MSVGDVEQHDGIGFPVVVVVEDSLGTAVGVLVFQGDADAVRRWGERAGDVLGVDVGGLLGA
ncbi:hypothetical protein ACH4E8_19505 [Streptomyces sp. NPDC017979]|uniref:hypothetical protein n=1 Tax=Streptomyces sp. NPDC017979 TaxID=3365024 RepID=UPI0037AFBC34